MYPAEFEYLSPTSVDEVLSLLARHDDEAKVLAGGQSLIPLMKLRFASPRYLIDINRIAGLDFLEEEGPDGPLRVGGLVRTSDIERSDVIGSRYGLMKSAAPLISDPIVRNLGTVVGSLCHADPQGDWASVMMALNGEVVARSTRGERTIPVTELIDGPFTTTLRPDELVTEVRVPRPSATSYGRYLKLERKVGDFASVGVAVHVDLDDERVLRAGIALTAVGSQNIKATAAEETLVGQTLNEAGIAEAARLAAEVAEPKDDMRGSADYKREMVRVFVRRGLGAALQQRAA
jgi:aerobic carbon-monoxide dehydrogenase medium subunit